MGGKLMYKLPNIWKPFVQTGFDKFDGGYLPNGKGSKAYKFVTDITVNGSTHLKCATSNHCAFTMDRDYTPLLQDMSPANVYGGQQVQYNVWAKSTLTGIA
jgi:hypothetical protein